MAPRCTRAACVAWLLVSASACDSPVVRGTSTEGHEPWAPRLCEQPALGFSSAGAGGATAGRLDLCGLDHASLGLNGALPDVQVARQRARAIVANWSEAQELSFIHGVSGAYVGNVPAVGALPALTLQDGPAGVAHFGDVTAFPAPIALAATWDRDLVQAWGEAMAAEERGKGAMIQLGPMLDLARTPTGGRIFEGFGEDPFLAAELAARDVIGIQSQKVVATAKHYVGNEQETNRMGGDSRIDERTLREVYYAPFAAAVAAGAGAVMCSYNRINGTYSCEDPSTLDDLKSELEFSGFVVSDWGATHSAAAAANAGLDLEMPLGQYFGGLGNAVDTGSVPRARLDDMASRILTSLVRVGVVDDPPTGSPSAVVNTSAHAALARTAASESVTLLKNEAGILPLDPAKAVLIVGEAGDTAPSAVGAGSAYVNAPYVVSPLDAFRARPGLNVSYDDGSTNSVAQAAATADVAIVFVDVPSGEGADRPSLASGLDSLIATVASANPNTVVVLNTPGAVLMPWLDRVRAVLVAWYPGQENGNAIASVLYGDQPPSGKLPLTFPASAEDLPAPDPSTSVTYSEKLAIGYRALDTNGTVPLFPFGFGLSYTRFSYSALRLGAGGSPGSIVASFELANTGSRSGTETAQLYLGFPVAAGEPPRVLRGFERATLAPGETQTMEIELPARAFSCWSAASHSSFVPSGLYRLFVGGSSRDLPLSAELEVSGL